MLATKLKYSKGTRHMIYSKACKLKSIQGQVHKLNECCYEESMKTVENQRVDTNQSTNQLKYNFNKKTKWQLGSVGC